MSYADLFDAISDLSLAALEAKRFGKKQAQVAHEDMPKEKALPSTPTTNVTADSATHKVPLQKSSVATLAIFPSPSRQLAAAMLSVQSTGGGQDIWHR